MRTRKINMPFELAFIIISIAVIAITYKTYVGYGLYPWYIKTIFLLLLIISICAPFICFFVKRTSAADSLVYLTKPLYFMFGFVFFLFIITFLRDIAWTIIDVVRRTPLEEMKNPPRLLQVNIITFIACLVLCFYGFYEAEKKANIVTYEITTAKVNKPTKVVLLADLHIDTDVSTKYVTDLVNRVNALKPDAVLIAGDIVDNRPAKLYKQMIELKKLQPKGHIFVVLGNHEFYSGALEWAITFGRMGFQFLNNYGMKLDDTGLYIAGIPDINSTQNTNMQVNVEQALSQANENDYKIILSHTPKIVAGMNKDNTDLVLSGHTHGGQIYPFHYFAKQANEGRLAGFYDVEGIKMYITRGTRYWGPPMRILAPSEITVFNFVPEKNKANDK